VKGRALLAALMSLAAALAMAEEGSSATLAAAAARGDVASVRRLLREGVDPDRGDRAGWTALHEAARAGHEGVLRALLEAGASPDPRSRALGTPLDIAERAGRPDLARLLRAHGAVGSGKSIGDAVCVRPWQGEGYCATVEARDATRFRLRVLRVMGCSGGCPPEPSCSAGRPVGPGGLSPGDVLWVPASCLTDTGLR
jgi:hypothetical protein